MKSPNLVILPVLLFIFITSSLQAQDIIVMKKDGETIKARITEVGIDEIKYKPWPVNETDPVIVLDKRKVRSITLESGTVLNFFMDDMDDPKNYEGQRKNLIKMDILAPVTGVTSLAYEHGIKPGRSTELGLGLIGLGFNTRGTNLRGAFVRVGYKFINTPDFTHRGMRYTHLLKGAYVRPELVFANYLYDENYTVGPSGPGGTYSTVTNSYRSTGGAVILNFGKQFVFDNVFAVDIFAGLGVGTKNTYQTKGTPLSGYYFGEGIISTYGFLGETTGIIAPALQFGLKAGLLVGSDRNKKMNK